MTTKEAFEAWYDDEEITPLPDDYTILGKRYLYMGWCAATTEANKRIAELESDVAELKGDLIELRQQTNIRCAQVQERDAKIYELQASNNHLREALEHADEFIRNGIEFGYIRMPDESLKGIDSAHDTPEIIRKTLSATPAKDCQYGKDVGMPEYTCVGKCQYASTPAESLQAHDNEVLERAAKVCDRYHYIPDAAPYDCAKAIHALKEVK